MARPLKGFVRSESNNYLVVNDCIEPRRAQVRIPCDTLENARKVRDFLSKHDVLGTYFGELLIYETSDKWEVIE